MACLCHYHALALGFVDKASLEEQTGFPVRHQHKKPGAADVLPMADAIIVGGASFNTLNKWALGVSDTLALGLITEGMAWASRSSGGCATAAE